MFGLFSSNLPSNKEVKTTEDKIKKLYSKMKSELASLKKREAGFKEDMKNTRELSKKKYDAAQSGLTRIAQLEKVAEFVSKYGKARESLADTVEKCMKHFSIEQFEVVGSLASTFDKPAQMINELKESVKETMGATAGGAKRRRTKKVKKSVKKSVKKVKKSKKSKKSTKRRAH